MRTYLLIASVAALAIPGLASAQTTCHQEKDNSRVVGTVVGAGLGALVGSALAGHHNATAPAIGGAVVGGFAGNAIGGSTVHCDRYDNGYYDRDGRWHEASGYYDRDGRWVRAYPGTGYYDSSGRWHSMRSADAYGRDAAYAGGGNLYARESDLEQRIHAADYNGSLSRYDADRLMRDLNRIRDRQAQLRADHDGLTDGDVADIDSRLDNLSDRLGDETR